LGTRGRVIKKLGTWGGVIGESGTRRRDVARGYWCSFGTGDCSPCISKWHKNIGAETQPCSSPPNAPVACRPVHRSPCLPWCQFWWRELRNVSILLLVSPFHLSAGHFFWPSYEKFPGCCHCRRGVSCLEGMAMGWHAQGNTFGAVAGLHGHGVPSRVWNESSRRPRALPCNGWDTCTRPWEI
jgi:hypothetical protein